MPQLYQHIGRGGRDGLPTTIKLLCKPEDFNEHESRINYEAEQPGEYGPQSRRIDHASAQKLRHSLTMVRQVSRRRARHPRALPPPRAARDSHCMVAAMWHIRIMVDHTAVAVRVCVSGPPNCTRSSQTRRSAVGTT